MVMNMIKKIKVCCDYLLIPVRAEEETKVISIYVGGSKKYEFAVPVGKNDGVYAFHYYAPVPMAEQRGKYITVEGDVPENFMEAVILSDSVPRRTHKRPVIHFAPDTGWLNDPNGMIFHDGVYHLFFQHNPFDTRWENMSWGHAVSRDLLHWRQKDDVLFPDEDGTMYSGCGIVNEREELGLGKDAEIFFYTCAGDNSEWSRDKKFVQKIAYSTDYGETLVKMDGCVLEHPADGNRDPKVYWHERSGTYYMVLYLEKNDYGIFNSEDLLHWEQTQRLTFPQTWECPDLREIPVEGGGSRWMFWGADGHYFLGDFDGSRFETDGICHEAYQSMLPYAAQTFWGCERVIMIPWMRTHNTGKAYTGIMGIPRQLTLVEKDGDYILRQRLVDEFENSKEKVFCHSFEKESGEIIYEQKCEAAVEVRLTLEENADFALNLYDTVCAYDAEKNILRIEGVAERSEAVKKAAGLIDKENMSCEEPEVRILMIGERLESISLLSDGEILEVTAQEGLVCGAYETRQDRKSGEIRIETDGKGEVEIFQITENES